MRPRGCVRACVCVYVSVCVSAKCEPALVNVQVQRVLVCACGEFVKKFRGGDNQKNTMEPDNSRAKHCMLKNIYAGN